MIMDDLVAVGWSLGLHLYLLLGSASYWLVLSRSRLFEQRAYPELGVCILVWRSVLWSIGYGVFPAGMLTWACQSFKCTITI